MTKKNLTKKKVTIKNIYFAEYINIYIKKPKKFKLKKYK